MFSNPIRPDTYSDEGTVLQVDAQRFLCKVKTKRQQILPMVTWITPNGGSGRGGDRFTPNVGDRVLVNHSLGYPIIVGCLPRIQGEGGATPQTIHDGLSGIDTGNYGPSISTIAGDQNKPKDFIPGDRVISSPGGALIAALRGGSVLLRASRTAEVFLNKIHGLVRIFSRNWEHFSDVSSDVIRNYKGHVYRYIGYAQDYGKTKIEDYRLHYYYGDTSAAEAIKTHYNSYTGTPAANVNLFKEQVTSDTATELMRRTIAINGNEEVYITDGSTFIRMNAAAGQIKLAWNDQNTATIDGTSIHFVHKDGADVIMDSSGIRSTMTSGGNNAEVNVTSDSVIATNSAGALLEITPTGVAGSIGASTLNLTSTTAQMQSNGHSITITASGVAIT